MTWGVYFSFLNLLLLTQSAFAADPMSVFIRVGGQPLDADWQVRQCAVVRKALGAGYEQAPCASLFQERQIEEARASGRYKYGIELRRTATGLDVTIETWARTDELDFDRVGWKVGVQPEADQDAVVTRLIQKNFLGSLQYERLVKENALIAGSFSSELIYLDTATGEYRDKKSGEVLSYEKAKDIFISEGPKNYHYLRTAVELATLLSAGWAMYNIFVETNKPDFEYGWNWPEQRRKIFQGEGIRFDDNSLTLNVGHSFAGAFYYMLPRLHGHNMLESFLVSLVASGLWETLVEYHEVLSINDMIVTPVAGVAIGETFFQLGRFFERSEDSILNKILGSIFNTEGALDRWIFSNSASRRSLNVDKYGFSKDGWHEFNIFAGAALNSRSAAPGNFGFEGNFGLNTEIINVPGYGEPGKFGKLLIDGNMTRMAINGAVGEKGFNEFLFFVKTSLVGWYHQNITADAAGRSKGYSVYFGAANAFDFSWSRTRDDPDFFGVVHVIGPTLDVNLYHKGFQIRATVDVYGDFALVRSFGYKKAAAPDPEYFTKSVLTLHDYYYAVGLTASSRVVMSYGPLEAGAQLKYEAFQSIQGHDRLQKQITDDFELTDSRSLLRLWIAYKLPLMVNTKVVLGYQRLERRGTASPGTVPNVSTEHRMTTDLQLTF